MLKRPSSIAIQPRRCPLGWRTLHDDVIVTRRRARPAMLGALPSVCAKLGSLTRRHETLALGSFLPLAPKNNPIGTLQYFGFMLSFLGVIFCRFWLTTVAPLRKRDALIGPTARNMCRWFHFCVIFVWRQLGLRRKKNFYEQPLKNTSFEFMPTRRCQTRARVLAY